MNLTEKTTEALILGALTPLRRMHFGGKNVLGL